MSKLKIILYILITFVGAGFVILFKNHLSNEPSLYSYITVIGVAALSVLLQSEVELAKKYETIIFMGLFLSGVMLAAFYIDSIHIIKLISIFYVSTFLSVFIREIFSKLTKGDTE